MLATYLPVKDTSKEVQSKLLLFRSNFTILPSIQMKYRYLCKCRELENLIKTEFSKLHHAIAYFRFELFQLQHIRENLVKQKISSRKERKILLEKAHKQEYILSFYREIIIKSCTILTSESISCM